MKKQKLITSLFMAGSLSLSASAFAISCAEMEFTPEMLGDYPDLNKACQEVIDYQGESYAKVDAEVVRAGVNTIRFKLLRADGTKSETYERTVPNDFRVSIDGEATRIRALQRGQKLSFYLPEDRFTFDAPGEGDKNAMQSAAVNTAAATKVAMLPSTASPLPLFGAFGALLVFVGGLLSRRRLRK